jgi:hypothetical protein
MKKHTAHVRETSSKLTELGIPHLLPIEGEFADSEIPRLVEDHFAKIDESDAVLVVNPDGYFGNSVKIEIGYAKGAAKKVFFMKETGAPELDCIADAIISINEIHSLKQD